jgi:hypothetical protein
MKTKIVEAEWVIQYEIEYHSHIMYGLIGVIYKKYFMDYRNNAEAILIYKLVKYEQIGDYK